MANASSSLSKGIASAIDKLEKKLIPKATQLPGGPKDHAFLVERLSNLRRLHTQSLETPMFSVVFLGDTQNGKSTLINALIGKKVLPEGHTGACSSAIVRCRYREKGPITATFTYTTREAFERDLDERLEDAQLALEQDKEVTNRKEQVCRQLARFLRLFDIEPQKYTEPQQIIEACRARRSQFSEAALLSKTEVLEVNTENERRIDENLSARGRTAFVVDECTIEGPFPDWHPQLELIDMPGTNAWNPWFDDVHPKVSADLHEELSGERVVRTSFRQYLDDWFNGKKAETAPSTMTFYRGSLAKFLQFLCRRSDDPMTEVTKQDVVAFRNSLITQVSAKTANHDLKALKMLFKSARRDGVVLKIPPNLLRLYGGKGDPRLNAHLRCRNCEVS